MALNSEKRAAASYLADGLTPGEIAEAMQIESSRVSRLLDDEEVKAAYRAELRHRSMSFYAKAVNLAGAMLSDGSAAVVQKAIHEALDAFSDAAEDTTGATVVQVHGMKAPAMPPPAQED